LLLIVVALACANSAAALTPNDPTWNLASSMRKVNMPGAWDVTTGDPNVIIGTVDTGVDSTIPDLQGALVPGWNFVGNNASTDDHQSHGTVTATEMVARGNNGQGIAGYCWRCKLMPVKVSETGEDFDPGLTAAGIVWAVDHGARIISISINDEGVNPTGDPQVAGAIAYAFQHNVFVAASAGNTGYSGLTFPAADYGAYPVAATDDNDVLYPWSTFGSWIHIAAPGCQLTLNLGSAYGPVCGNSMTAPAIAGIAGLMLSVNPGLTPPQIEAALESSTVPVNGIVNGRVDAFRALLAVGGRLPTPPPPPPPPPPSASTQLKPVAGPKMKTRVQRGYLGRHRQVGIKIRTGKVAAVLRSSKAKSCTLSLRSSDSLWSATRHARNLVSVAARLRAGRYTVDIWCSVRAPRKFALSVSAFFS
jgi:subtilisin family serine protease